MRSNKNKEAQLREKMSKPVFAKKSFGQNFLVDQNYINKIISALNPQKDEIIIEIGAGRGALTEQLVESGAQIIAIEIERDMIRVLQEKFGDYKNFQLIEGDALKLDYQEIQRTKDKGQRFKLVANLPYYISTAILQKLIEQREVFSEIILMFQREVVERITAKIGNSERGFLTVLVEAYLDTETLFNVPPTAFRPAPKVQSAVVRLKNAERGDKFLGKEDLFREVVSAGFMQKRKTILNNLKNVSQNLKVKIPNAEKLLEICQINSQRRAETLSLDEWLKIIISLESAI